MSTKKSLDEVIRDNLNQYLRDLGDVPPHGLHEMMMAAMERPLLDVVMQRAQGNQSKAADWLGINRNTLRRKLSDYRLVD